MDKQILDEYQKILLGEYKQIFEGVFFHPEAGGDDRINVALSNIGKDLIELDDSLINTGVAINDLMNNTIARLELVRKNIMLEKERYQDIQMLCNKYTDFDNVKTLENLSFKGSFSYEDGIIYGPVKRNTKVNLTVLEIDGNGYEGNEYVYNNFEYQKNTYDTSIRKNIVDNKINTYYEYSRITVQNSVEETNSYFNKDNAKARCTISFEAKENVNYLNISTEDMGVYISNIQYSMDGIKYYDLKLKSKISINNKLDSYQNYGYVYGSGVISVPLCKYFKITFETDRNTEDTIAYEKSIIIGDIAEENVTRDPYSGVITERNISVQPITETSTCILEGAKRSVIRINDISAYKKVFSERMQIATDNLITTDAFSISLFANVYVPEELDDKAIKFELLVNGVMYEVVPINSNLNGTKVIRFSGGKSNSNYTKLISEVIKSARLIITFSNKSTCTPYINNLKILIGGEI